MAKYVDVPLKVIDKMKAKRNAEQLKAAGFIENGRNDGAAVWILSDGDFSLVWVESVIKSLSIASMVSTAESNSWVKNFPNVKTVDDVLTLARFLGLSEVE